MSRAPLRRRLVVAALCALTALCALAISTRLRLDPNVATLLPERGDAAALRRYLRAFGGSDLAVVLVEHDDAERAAALSQAIAAELRELPSVAAAADRLEEPARQLDPMLAWRHADARARAKLAEALTPAGMRQRLRDSRALLLAPGSGSASEAIARDPLRLAALLFEQRGIGSGWRTQADGSFASDDGRARVVLVHPRGQALRGEDARAFVRDADGVLARHRAADAGARLGLTGGHALAAATERMLTADLTLSGTLSFVLAALAFALTFRRLRALVAVLPPLLLGTVWTAGIAALLPAGLSAIAVAFMSVVIGVGVDTGVHVYAALLEAREQGLAPAEAARAARRRTARPVLVAAATAAAAFAALGLSEIAALQQLGWLCASGEMLTALAIVAITPEIGARLERQPPPPWGAPRWTGVFVWLSATRTRALLVVLAAATPLAALLLGYLPAPADAIVALRPAGLEPIEVQDRIYRAFGGRRGQWVVLVGDRDREAARERADRIAERLAELGDDVESIDALTALVPSLATQRARLEARDALDPGAKAGELERALAEVGFAPERFADALAAMRAPSHELVELAALSDGPAEVMLSRYLGQDGDDALVALYLLPRQDAGAQARVEAAVREVDPAAAITGYARLDLALRESLARDLPRVGAVAAVLVIVALALSLRRAREVVLAAAVVVIEIAAVLVLTRLLSIPLHAYDALVLPVLLGITVDEGMFLLHRARREGGSVPETLAREAGPVATTALTTAVGFGALAACDFDGLRHLGLVGALGSVVGLFVALAVVPAGLRLMRRA